MAIPLLLPFAAPFLSASIPALAGMGAIGTGLLAGGLGAAEAAARGMEDPLQRGLLAGLTGGAMAGIGNALSTAGQTAATTAATTGAQAVQQPLMTTAQLASGAAKAAPAAVAPPVFAPNPAMMAAESAPLTMGQRFGQMGQGIKALSQPGAFKAGGVGTQFLKDVKTPALAGAAGMMGQSMLDTQEDALKTAREREEEERQKALRTQEFMSSTVLPQYRVGPRYMAQGGIVGLMGGGPVNKTLTPAERNELIRLQGMAASMGGELSVQDQMRLRQLTGGSQMGTGAAGTTPKPYESMPTPATADPQYNAFMRQLAAGAGNRLASQRSGYTGLPKEEVQMARGGYLDGGRVAGDGMSDSVPAMIDGQQPAALSSGEFVIPADVVSGLGNGSSDSGAKQLYSMMDRIRQARTGQRQQAPQIQPQRYMPA